MTLISADTLFRWGCTYPNAMRVFDAYCESVHKHCYDDVDYNLLKDFLLAIKVTHIPIVDEYIFENRILNEMEPNIVKWHGFYHIFKGR